MKISQFKVRIPGFWEMSQWDFFWNVKFHPVSRWDPIYIFTLVYRYFCDISLRYSVSMNFSEIQWNFDPFIYVSVKFSDFYWNFNELICVTELHWNISGNSMKFTEIFHLTEFQWNFSEIQWNFTDHFP